VQVCVVFFHRVNVFDFSSAVRSCFGSKIKDPVADMHSDSVDVVIEPGPASSEQASAAALQEVRRLPGWQVLLDVLAEESKVSFRQVLSHHTSTPCQPGKAEGVTTSLKDSGLDTSVGTSVRSKKVRLQIPYLFECGRGLSDNGRWGM